MSEYSMNMQSKYVINERTGIHYTLIRAYYFPTCALTDRPPIIGKWANLYDQYLLERHPQEYTWLIWSNKLSGVLESVQRECTERMENLIRQMAEAEGINEALKTYNQMKWVQQMNNIRNRAEEILAHELMP